MSAYEIYTPDAADAAFEAVYRAHSEKLFRYCQYRLRDRFEAEDVVQEAFVRAWRTRPGVGPDQSFYPWLRVVAGNLCTDILRKRSRSEPMAVIDLGVVDGGMDRLSEEADRDLLRRALDRLNDRHRAALMMREAEGLTYEQIAARTGVTASTVESLLWRARQALRREFTVVAGGEGSLAVVPVALVLLARFRDGGRRAWARLARRPPFLSSPGDSPLVHAAMAAVAALSIASGVAWTLDHGGGHAATPTDVPPGSVQPVPASVSAAPPAPAATTGSPAAAPPGTSPSAASTLPAAAGSGIRASTPASDPSPLRVVNPVMVGGRAGTYAAESPVALRVAGFAVGASPPAVAAYVHSLTQRVGSAVPGLNPAAQKEPMP